MVSNCAIYLTNMLLSTSFASAFMNSLVPFSSWQINKIKLQLTLTKEKEPQQYWQFHCCLKFVYYFSAVKWTLANSTVHLHKYKIYNVLTRLFHNYTCSPSKNKAAYSMNIHVGTVLGQHTMLSESTRQRSNRNPH